MRRPLKAQQRQDTLASVDAAALPAPRRWHFALLALLFLSLAIYGSLVPFHYTPLEFQEAIERFEDTFNRPAEPVSHADWITNLLLFVPVGYCFLAVFGVDQRRRLVSILCVPLISLMCAASSIAIEFAQLWFAQRTTSRSDVIAQIIGTLVGMGVWLSMGQTITDWLRSYTGSRRAKDKIDWLLQAYFVGLILYSVMPLDLTIHPVQLYQKFRAGKIEVIPFSYSYNSLLEAAYAIATDLLVYAPIGMLSAVIWNPRGRATRSLRSGIFVGILLVVAIELLQLFVYSRYTSSTDVIMGSLGICLGVWVMRRWRGEGQTAPPLETGARIRHPSILWLIGFMCYGGFLVVLFWAPFEFSADRALVQSQLNRFFVLPFVRLYEGSYIKALFLILRKTLWFVPLGFLMAHVVACLPVKRSRRRVLLAAGALTIGMVASVIELGQVLMPEKVADLTDVLLSMSGGIVGLIITSRILVLQSSLPAPAEAERMGERNSNP